MARRIAECRFCHAVLPVNSRYLCSDCNREAKETDEELDALVESRRATMPPSETQQPRCRAPGIRIFPDPRRRGK